ncbi:MAG: hypothetical protein JSS69_13575 [Acidobacteria bacterium]|nr:hypothetical protein [Acidobacteriota bacterium]MBS1866939.1 hypothetical protein [Acidobacteriota bacterium]
MRMRCNKPSRSRQAIRKFGLAVLIAAGCAAGAYGQGKPNAAPCGAINPGPRSANLADAMKIPAREIDAALPEQCIADWLVATLGTNSFDWSLSDCEKPAKEKAPANSDKSRCLVADGSTAKGVSLHVKIQVGSRAKPVSGKPAFREGSVTGCGRKQQVPALGELKAAMQYVSAACKK